MEFQIIYKTENFLAINKPAGFLVHPLKAISYKLKTEETLVDWLLKKFPEIKTVGDDPKTRPGIVHRLDKDTSGVIIIARNQKYFEYLKHLFQTHQIKKTYLALVYGIPEKTKGVIDKAISLKAGTTKRTIHTGKMTKDAITEYEVIKTYEYVNEKGNAKDFSLVKLIPKTGRAHQLRVHMNFIHHSIVGDPLYGQKENPFGLKRQFLHAESIEFTAEDGKRIKLEADLPEELKGVIAELT